MDSNGLMQFAGAVASGAVRVVDLTFTLSPDFPVIVLPPEFGQAAPVRIQQISRYDGAGPAWYWNNLTFGEHTGTHFDAPIHWFTGKDLPNNSVDTLPVRIVRCPVAFPPLTYYQLWHDVTHASAANRWLREQIVALFGEK